MENYLEPTPVQQVPVLATVSFRRRLSELPTEQWLQNYVLTVYDWFKYRSITILAHTIGLHRNASYPHFHLHFVVTCNKILSNPLSTFKYDIKEGKSSVHTCAPSILTLPEKTTIAEWLGGERWTSIKMKSQDHLDDPDNLEIVKFLSYPLKEADDFTTSLLNSKIKVFHDVTYYGLNPTDMMVNANQIYKSACILRDKKELKVKAVLSEWETVKQIADACPRNFHEIASSLLIHYRDNVEHPPHPKVIIQKAEKYCYKVGIFSIDQLIQQYSTL